MVTLFILYLLFLIACICCLRSFARREMFESGEMLFWFIVASCVPAVNIIALIVEIVCICINIVSEIDNLYYNIDDYAKKLFHVKDKKNDDADNFKGKGYR